MAGGILGLILYCPWKKLPVLRVLDSTALTFPVAQIIGRFANIINGGTWGPPTKLPWGFTYTNPNALIPANLLGVPTHPTPVYVNNIIFLGMREAQLLAVAGIILAPVAALLLRRLAKRRSNAPAHHLTPSPERPRPEMDEVVATRTE